MFFLFLAGGESDLLSGKHNAVVCFAFWVCLRFGVYFGLWGGLGLFGVRACFLGKITSVGFLDGHKGG